MINTMVFCIIAYLIGSLSSSIIVCKIFKLPDPRTEGSKNPGTTNVLRIGGKIPAIITLAVDVLKGFLPVFIAHQIGFNGFSLGLIALSAFLGHLLPIFFNFQGGKGVATAFGVFLALSPVAAIIILCSWILVAFIFRYSSLAAIVAATLAPIFILLFADKAYLFPALIITIILLWRHTENIKRLLAGTESKIKLG